MIFGIGVDLVDIDRIEESFKKFAQRFASRMFTQVEQDYCNRMPIPAQHYAARFAAKEAFMKALGTGKSQGISWKDVSIENLQSGKPMLLVNGKARELLESSNINGMYVSLSHSKGHAVAVVMLECPDA